MPLVPAKPVAHAGLQLTWGVGEARLPITYTRRELQALTRFSGCCLCDFVRVEARKRLQDTPLLHCFLQQSLLDHPRHKWG